MISTVQYKNVILKILEANISIKFVTRVYAMLAYLTSCLCRQEHIMSELI